MSRVMDRVMKSEQDIESYSDAQVQAASLQAGNSQAENYTPLLLAFGPADHAYEKEGSEEEAYILGYN